MSVEALVLITLFVVLPLIQRLREAMRERNRRAPEPVGGQGQVPESPPPRVRTRRPPPESTGPPLQDETPHAASGAMPAVGRRPDARRPVKRALTPARERGRRRRPTADLRTRRDLRRAIVLTTVLGPCRATRPHDWPEQ
jgi:hypothetical protein